MDAPAPESPEGKLDFPWEVSARLAEIDGEARANVLRTIAVAAFYGLEVAAYHGVALGPLELSYARTREAHLVLSLLAALWVVGAIGVRTLLRRGFVPPALKFATTAGDLAFLTAMLAISEGPKSPAIVGYLLVVALAGTRMSLSLVRFATAATAVAWLVLLGVSKWGMAVDSTVPRYHQLVMLVAIVLLGVITGQGVRRARLVAIEYAERRDAERIDSDRPDAEGTGGR